MPNWLRPARRSSLAEIAMNVLTVNWQGLKLSEIEKEIQQTGREVHKPSLTAALGRLKRDERIVRRNGRWKKVAHGDEPAEPPVREYEKDDYMD
jgi:hypothetical protein